MCTVGKTGQVTFYTQKKRQCLSGRLHVIQTYTCTENWIFVLPWCYLSEKVVLIENLIIRFVYVTGETVLPKIYS